MATKHSVQQAAADAAHATRVSLKLNNENDADILAWLSDQDSRQAAIKDAIRYYLWAETHNYPPYGQSL